MMVDSASYRIRWAAIPRPWAQGFKGTLPDRVPFMVPLGGASGEPGLLKPEMLIDGILYAGRELSRGRGPAARPVSNPGPGPAPRPVSRPGQDPAPGPGGSAVPNAMPPDPAPSRAGAVRASTLKAMISHLGWRVGRGSVESLALARARRARSDHGPMVSARMLFQAAQLCPESDAVRAALICDIWRLLEHADHLDVDSACAAIVQHYERVDAARIDRALLEWLDYAYCAALHLLSERDKLTTFFWRTAAHRVREPKLRERLTRLVDDRTLDLHDLRLGGGVRERAGQA